MEEKDVLIDDMKTVIQDVKVVTQENKSNKLTHLYDDINERIKNFLDTDLHEKESIKLHPKKPDSPINPRHNNDLSNENIIDLKMSCTNKATPLNNSVYELNTNQHIMNGVQSNDLSKAKDNLSKEGLNTQRVDKSLLSNRNRNKKEEVQNVNELKHKRMFDYNELLDDDRSNKPIKININLNNHETIEEDEIINIDSDSDMDHSDNDNATNNEKTLNDNRLVLKGKKKLHRNNSNKLYDTIKLALESPLDVNMKAETILEYFKSHQREIYRLELKDIDLTNEKNRNAAVIAKILYGIKEIPKVKFNSVQHTQPSLRALLLALKSIIIIRRISFVNMGQLQGVDELFNKCHIERASFKNCKFKKEQIQSLMQALIGVNKVKIVNSGISDKNLEAIISMIGRTSVLEELDLSGISISKVGLKKLLMTCDHSKVKKVTLRNMKTDSNIVKEINKDKYSFTLILN